MGNNIALAESAATVYQDKDQGEQQNQEIADVEKDSGGGEAQASEEQPAGEEKEAGDAGDGESKEGSDEQAGGEEKEEGDGGGEGNGEGDGGGEGGEGGEEQEEEQEEELRVTVDDVKTAPMDFRFPTTNQAKHCYTRYNEFHKCAADKGEDSPECAKFAKFYRSLCPGEWIDKWNEEREMGTFAGRY